MVELILAGAVAVISHVYIRRFVARRLRFTPVVQKRKVGLAASIVVGGALFLVGQPLFAIPLVTPWLGTGTAFALGAGGATGVWYGRRQAKNQKLLED
ncbi:MAG: hypothetical protein J4G12_07240 [Gemmatimonadetes bacterium]|nr:hypothetical protein [Gemmatimonadota bacterium]